MQKNYCHIVAILDRSGSMGGLADKVIESYNQFISDQKEVDGKATVTLVQFDGSYEVNYEFTDIQVVPMLDRETYSPRGLTAMNDAIGKTINSTGQALAEMDEADRPEKVIILIQTDGDENDSREFTNFDVKEMIKKQQDKYSWEFVFMGANIDAKSVAHSLNIKADNAIKFANNSEGLNAGIKSFSQNTTMYRSGMKTDMSYEKSDIDAQNAAGV